LDKRHECVFHIKPKKNILTNMVRIWVFF